MSRKLHVANLDLSTGNEELERLFAEHGVVRRAQVMVHRSLGCGTATGLVEMDSEQEGSAAIAILNGQEYRGHALLVDWATDVDHCEMFEAMNTPEPLDAPQSMAAEPSDMVRGPRPGDFGDRSGKRSTGGSGGSAQGGPKGDRCPEDGGDDPTGDNTRPTGDHQ